MLSNEIKVTRYSTLQPRYNAHVGSQQKQRYNEMSVITKYMYAFSRAQGAPVDHVE